MCGGCDNCAFLDPKVTEEFYEIHITVSNQYKWEAFRSYCESINVKPIYILNHSYDMYRQLPESYGDIMTSHKFKGSYAEAINALHNISQSLTDAGFSVVRNKIETVPWHKDIKHTESYFECHLDVDLEQYTINQLVLLGRNVGFFVSSNALKNAGAMITFRLQTNDKAVFDTYIEKKLAWLATGYNIIPAKVITEYAIYDDNQAHDNDWIKQ